MKTPPVLSPAVMRCQTPDTLAALGYVAPPERKPDAKPAAEKRIKMTKTEARYLAVLKTLEEAGEITDVKFHPVSFHLDNGHRYTPDFSYNDNGRIYLVEVKGSYKLGSYQRARMAFDQARIEWPLFVWIWAELGEDGAWTTNPKTHPGVGSFGVLSQNTAIRN